jgi:hypothetical protein
MICSFRREQNNAGCAERGAVERFDVPFARNKEVQQ